LARHILFTDKRSIKTRQRWLTVHKHSIPEKIKGVLGLMPRRMGAGSRIQEWVERFALRLKGKGIS
jgi:hypothetical protein